MRIELQDLHPDAFVDPHWLSDHVLRVRFAPGRRVPSWFDRLLIEARSKAADADAPGPSGAGRGHGSQDRHDRYVAALAEWRHDASLSPVAEARKPSLRARLRGWIVSPRLSMLAARQRRSDDPPSSVADLVHRTFAHLLEPLAVYTNGMRALTLVCIGPSRYELAELAPLRELIHACSDFADHRPLRPHQCVVFASIDAAESEAFAELRGLDWSEIALADRRSGEAIAGSAWLHVLGADRTWQLRYGDVVRTHHLGRNGDPRRLLRELGGEETCVRCCGSCAHFAFSGMSYDMSDGEAGYCERRRAACTAAGDTSSEFDERVGTGRTVSILDLCGEWRLEEAMRTGARGSSR